MLTQPANRGKGAAVRRGINESSGDILLIQDADLEYSPSDIPALIDPLLSGKADAVFGTRLRGGAHPQRAHLFWHYAGNRFLTLLANVLYNTTISDMEVGYKAFRGDLVRGLDLISDDFRIEPELTAKVLRLGPGIRLYEVPISYYGRSYAEGKKITWRDGFGAVGALLRFRFTASAGSTSQPADDHVVGVDETMSKPSPQSIRSIAAVDGVDAVVAGAARDAVRALGAGDAVVAARRRRRSRRRSRPRSGRRRRCRTPGRCRRGRRPGRCRRRRETVSLPSSPST